MCLSFCISRRNESNSDQESKRYGKNCHYDQQNSFEDRKKLIQREKTEVVLGFQNSGNMCYLNTGLQCLINSTFFRDYFTKNFNPNSRGQLAGSLNKLVQQIKTSGSKSNVTLNELKSAFFKYCPSFKGSKQQDCLEFLSNFLNALHDELKQKSPYSENQRQDQSFWQSYKSANDSIIADITHGLYKTQITCDNCKAVQMEIEPFLSIPLGVSHGDSTNSVATIQSLLQEELADRYVGHQNTWYCQSCSKFGTAQMSRTLERIPKLLIFQLKRFHLTAQSIKAQIKLEPEFRLDLQNRAYSLYAVANHHGSFQSGHYTAYCKQEVPIFKIYQNIWYCCNDEHVQLMQEHQVVSSSSYLLFYQKEEHLKIHKEQS